MGAAALAIGTGIQMYSAMEAGEQKKAAYAAEAANKRAQAAQVEIATNRELDLTRRRFDKVQAAQKMAFSRSGVAVTSGSPLMLMEETAANAFDEMRAIRDAGQYRKTSLLTEGLYSERAGQQAEDAAFLQMIGAGVGGFAKNPYVYDQKGNL